MSCSNSKRLVLRRAQRKVVFQAARSWPSGAARSPAPLLGGHLPRARAQAWGGRRRMWAGGDRRPVRLPSHPGLPGVPP